MADEHQLCNRCRSEYQRLFEIAKAEGFKAGFYEGVAMFQKEIALARAMRPIMISLPNKEPVEKK